MSTGHGVRTTDGASTSRLVSTAIGQFPDLLRGELRLAQAEMAAKGKRIGAGGGMFGAAGVATFLATQAALAAAIAGVAEALPVWAAALIVAGALAASAGLLVVGGRGQMEKAGSPVPEQTVASLRGLVGAPAEGPATTRARPATVSAQPMSIPELRRQVEAEGHAFAETMHALADKTRVKARAKHKAVSTLAVLRAKTLSVVATAWSFVSHLVPGPLRRRLTEKIRHARRQAVERRRQSAPRLRSVPRRPDAEAPEHPSTPPTASSGGFIERPVPARH